MPDESVASIIASHTDGIFFPNIRELLKILAVLPIGSTEAERSFSCRRRPHTWLRSIMTRDRLSDLSVIAMHVTRWLLWRLTAFAEHLLNSIQEG